MLVKPLARFYETVFKTIGTRPFWVVSPEENSVLPRSNYFLRKEPARMSPPNRQTVTIQDIAEKAQVSKSTVSRVLNNTTPVNEKKKAAVLKAMQQLDYRPNVFARGLAGGQSMTIGVVTQNIGSPFYDSVTQGLVSAFSGTGYFPLVVDGQWKPDIEVAAIRTLLERQVDGLILVGGKLTGAILQELARDVPCVIVAQKLPGWEDRCVTIDNIDGGFRATQFLIELGHTEIAHLTGIADHDDAKDRLEGYKRALKHFGIPLKQKLIVEGNFSSQSGVLAIGSLLTRGVQFSAIFAANDEMALGARLALYRRGIRVPEDISIIGFDDQPASAYMTPPLTTVAQPALEMGCSAAKMMLRLLCGQPLETPNLPVQIVVRESVVQRR